jgi:Putative transposase/Transposase zinc-binding domain
MRCSLQEVFAEHFDAYAQCRTLHPRESRAAWCIRHCFQPALGYHVLECAQGHHRVTQFHACRHRSCPRCAARPREQWLASQLAQLLPCAHFHVVFTLPHELIAMWQFNRSWFNQLLFDCVRQALLQLCADARHLGATPGLLMALHSWGRTLSHHPHVHCLVSAGGVAGDGQWLSCRAGFLLPLRPLQHLFRGKLLAALRLALRAQHMKLPAPADTPHWLGVVKSLYRKHFNIQINPPYAHGRAVAMYLARYVKGGPLGAGRALKLDSATVAFTYVDHRDKQRKILRLHAHEFIARVLWHAPPRGQHTVRRAGLYASGLQRQHRQAALALQPFAPPRLQPSFARPHPEDIARPALCPTCGSTLHKQFFAPKRRSPEHQLGEFSRTSTPPPEHLGPTLRSTGQPTAKRPRPQPPPYHLAAAGGGV